MRPIGVGFVLSAIAAVVLQVASRTVVTQGLPPGFGAQVMNIAPSALDDVRTWDTELTRMRREGTLRLVRERADTLMPGRQHERLAQYYGDVLVFGAEATRQSENGVPISMLGRIYRDIDVATTPRLSPDDARGVMLGAPGASAVLGDPELLILPLDDGRLALAYRLVTVFPDDILVSFVDAVSGSILLQFTDLQTQAAAAACSATRKRSAPINPAARIGRRTVCARRRS